jgi:hypothetical protein
MLQFSNNPCLNFVKYLLIFLTVLEIVILQIGLMKKIKEVEKTIFSQKDGIGSDST